jgi:DHA2 family multidrug resistance protein-like MFS transporter
MSTRYQEHLTASLAGRNVPSGILQVILGSLGGALAVAERLGGATGAELARAARAAFMNGSGVAMAIGGAVALGGAVVTLIGLPARAADHPPEVDAVPPEADPEESRDVVC